MGKLILNPYEGTFKKVANQQILGNAGGSAGSRTPDHLIKSQMISFRNPSNTKGWGKQHPFVRKFYARVLWISL